MNVVQPLLDLQEIDGRIRALQQEEKDIPQRKEQESARLNGTRAALEQAKSELKTAQAKVADAELEVGSFQDKIRSLKQKQTQLKTNKEFQAYNLEIARIEADIETHEARLIATMDDVTVRKHAVAENEAKMRDEQATADAYIAELDARMAEVRAELAAQEAARQDAVRHVQPRPLAYYEKLRTRRWPVVVQLQADGVCKGCNLVQPPSVAQMVRRNQDLTVCQMCGRILYI